LTPAVFWQQRESLLRLDRDDLEDGLEKAKSQGLTMAMEKLDFRDREAGGGGSSKSNPDSKPLVGVPGPSSRLALDVGPPVTPVEPWSPESETSGAVTIYVVEIAKGQSYSNTIYPFTTQGSSDVVVAIPSPKTDSWGYRASLVKLVSYLRAILNDSTRIIIVPGTSEHLELAISLASTVQTSGSTTSPVRLNILAKPADMVSARKFVIPIALLLLCAYPGLSRGATEEASEEEEDAKETLTKGQISSVLLSLVALWPDGNPPRAALKRVNEVLLSNPKT
jgi:tRNA A64-2'-O-ribosylphosphate transferase